MLDLEYISLSLTQQTPPLVIMNVELKDFQGVAFKKDMTTMTPSSPNRRAGIKFSSRRSLILQQASQSTPQGRKMTPNGVVVADTGIIAR